MIQDAQKTKRKRVLSGMRPTGRLHIGHYFGALSNWLKMQEEYDCYFFVADWHALTTHYADSSQVAANTLEVATDWLAVGLDPRTHDNVTLFIQSAVPEHAELHLLLSMITPLSWLERVPTYKEQIENLRDKDLGTYGFLGYPLLQSADIVMYGEPGQQLLVPVGEDQAPHIEMTREIVRKFNFSFSFAIDEAIFAERNKKLLKAETKLAIIGDSLIPPPGRNYTDEQKNEIRAVFLNQAREVGIKNFYAWLSPQELKVFFISNDVLQEPDVILTETPRVPGTDGRRMAKSYGNTIWLSDPPEEIRKKAHNMMTDPQRVRRTDPGRPEVCPVFAYHNLFPVEKSAEDRARIERVNRECRTAEIGCVDCKKLMADALVKWIEPVQARRREYEANPQRVWGILEDGSKRAKRVAEQTMERVREAVFNWERAGRPGATIGAGKGKVAAEK